MLREYPQVRQVEGEPFRRWFSSSYFDLIVWYDDANAPTGFQLCYDKEYAEHALTCQLPNHYSHAAIDGGEGSMGGHKGSPILVADGQFNIATVMNRFRRESAKLPADLAALVLLKLEEYPSRVQRRCSGG